MAKDIAAYQPIFYAQEALIQLENALGMAGRIHRGYDPVPKAKGESIQIKRPATFTAANAPATAVDLDTDSVSITLDQWKEVKFKLTDKDLSLTEDRIIADHIRPAAYALADNIDSALAGLYTDIPWHNDLSAPAAVADLTALQRLMFVNKVPMEDESLIHLMLDGITREEFLNLTAFSQFQGAGQGGTETQRRGSLGTKYGFNIFANQNTKTHTAGTCADFTGALTADAAAGASSIAIDAVTSGGTAKAGDTLIIAGNSQRYAITADVTFTGGAGTIAVTPELVVGYTDNDVVTGDVTNGGVNNLAFHKNAFALAMAPLSEMGNELGAKIATVSDPKTNLSLRSRIYYVGDSSVVHVALDVLYGFVTLDPNLGARLVNTA